MAIVILLLIILRVAIPLQGILLGAYMNTTERVSLTTDSAVILRLGVLNIENPLRKSIATISSYRWKRVDKGGTVRL